MVRTLVLPEWRSRKVVDITPTDVDRLLTKVAAGRPRVWRKTVKPVPTPRTFKAKQSKPMPPPKTYKPTPVRANQVGEVLRKMFSLAVTWKMRTDNPATSFRKRPETARERFLSFEEIQRLADALCADPDQRALLLRARDFLDERLSGPAVLGPIHADVLRENVLVQGEALSLIDFDDSGIGFRLYDLGTAMSQNLYEPDPTALRDALMEGYGTSDAEMVEAFTLARCCASVGWVMPRLAPDHPVHRSHLARFALCARRVMGG